LEQEHGTAADELKNDLEKHKAAIAKLSDKLMKNQD
jgi:hypothetical protein